MKKHGTASEKEADESSILHRKAAVWAWYQHGRRRDSRIHNLQTKSAHFSSGFTAAGSHASRFKAEAEKPDTSLWSAGRYLALLSLLPREQTQKYFLKDRKDGKQSDSPWDCGSSLYDSFELLSLSNQLGRCLMTIPAVASPIPECVLEPRIGVPLSKLDLSRTVSVPRNLTIPTCFCLQKAPKPSPIMYPFSASAMIDPSELHNLKGKSKFLKAFRSLIKYFHRSPETKQVNEAYNACEKEKLLNESCVTSERHHEQEREHCRYHHHYYHPHYYKNELLHSSSMVRTRKMLQSGLSEGINPLILPREIADVVLPLLTCKHL